MVVRSAASDDRRYLRWLSTCPWAIFSSNFLRVFLTQSLEAWMVNLALSSRETQPDLRKCGTLSSLSDSPYSAKAALCWEFT